MISFVRRHLNYANVAVTAALVFAMSGGAFALGGGTNAAKNTGTSTSATHGGPVATAAKKSKAKSKSTRGPAGPRGKQGPAGPEGKVGATGPQGSEGKVGATGPQGSEGKEGKEGKQGEPGLTGYTKYLPAGETETGYFMLHESNTAAGKHVISAISFNIPLELEEGVYIPAVTIAVGGAPTSECPGTVQEPTAEEGYLCLYESKAANLGGEGYVKAEVFATKQTLAATATGTELWVLSEAEGEVWSSGTWAVTAP
ncbi:MAG TPA: hypothetical protein VGF95_04440 [Solirubrobacteraceae bacterium]|jgi:hypothetical protein